jgi:large subunit ribosomal protein L13
MKTFLPKVDEITRNWKIVDADGLILGRLAARVANVLRGKDKPCFTRHLDCGDFVIVINAAKVKLTGRKETHKIYRKFTGYMGGVKEAPAAEVRARKPTRLVEEAVWGMMPKSRLARQQFRKLKIYAGAEHPHEAQQPEAMTIS